MPRSLSNHVRERERFVEDLLGYMTLEERIGQLVLLPYAPDPAERGSYRQDQGIIGRLRRGLVTGVVDVDGPAQAERLQRIAIEETRLGIPLFFAGETGRGVDTILPAPVSAAASWDVAAIEAAEKLVGEEAAQAGTNWALAPWTTLSRYAARDGFAESSGESEWLAALHAAARIRGLQSVRAGLLACLTLGDGHPSGDRRRSGSGALLASELGILGEALAAGGPASIAIDAPGAHEPGAYLDNASVLTVPGGYSGMLLSTWAEFASRSGQETTHPPYSGLSNEHVLAAVQDGRIEPEAIDDAVRRVLSAKFDLGLFRPDFEPVHDTGTASPAASIGSRDAALDLARKSIVLLRNTPALLPLTVDSGGILVVGTAAGDRSLPMGGARGNATSVIDGLDAIGLTHKFVPGLALRQGQAGHDRLVDADRMAIGMAGEAARRSRTVVVVVGDDARVPGTHRLGEAHQTLLETLHAANERIVLVTLGAKPVDPDVAGEPLPCVLHAGQLGTMSGRAIAEILAGEASPTGRLPFAVRTRAGEERLPFGHGLAYTEFALSNFVLELGADRLSASVLLHNRGDRHDTDCVQLYVRKLGEDGEEVASSLRDFRHVALDPGTSEPLTFELGARELGRHREDGSFTVEAGNYEVRIGHSATAALAGEIAIPQAVADAIELRRLSSDTVYPFPIGRRA